MLAASARQLLAAGTAGPGTAGPGVGDLDANGFGGGAAVDFALGNAVGKVDEGLDV